MNDTPTSSAFKLLSQYGIEDPTDVPIEDLIWAQGGIYVEKPMSGAEGRIIFGTNKSAIIVVNQTIKSPEKLRFIRAHELGHLRLHRLLRPFFHCDTQAFLERNKQGSHESEANAFAAELLMPEHLFLPLIRAEPFSVELLQKTARRFQTSLSVTAYRYAELGVEPLAFFFSQNGQIEWAHRSEGYLATYLQTKKPLNSQSVTYRCIRNGVSSSVPELVPAEVWFNDRRVPGELLVYEHCVLVPSMGGAYSFVWMSNQYR
jgi:Zn-dependent peptidase ImmA (M78 family)